MSSLTQLSEKALAAVFAVTLSVLSINATVHTPVAAPQDTTAYVSIVA